MLLLLLPALMSTRAYAANFYLHDTPTGLGIAMNYRAVPLTCRSGILALPLHLPNNGKGRMTTRFLLLQLDGRSTTHMSAKQSQQSGLADNEIQFWCQSQKVVWKAGAAVNVIQK